MTTYNIPSTIKRPESLIWSLVANSVRSGNPFNNTFITATRPGTLWKVQISWAVLTIREEGLLTSFFQSLNGMQHRVRLHDFARENGPEGNASGTGRVMGSGQTGVSLNTDGWPINTTIFYPGDWFSVNGELKRITNTVVSSGLGQATINFAPALRSIPSDNTILDYTQPTAVFSIEDPNVSYGTPKTRLSDFSISLIEDIQES